MRTMARILRTSPSDLLLLAEAGLLLTASWMALKWVSTSRLMGWLQRPAGRASQGDPLPTLRRVQWAVLAWARRWPKTFVCFPQSVAAYVLLRRKGILSVISYGVMRSPSGELCAHTWLEAGSFVVVGGAEAPGFTVIQTLP